MSKKRKIVQADEDGTPLAIVEVEDTDTPDADEPELPPASEPETVAEPIPEPEPEKAAVEGARAVTWTKLGDEHGVWSEHGRAVEGETFTTTYADMFVELGYVKEAGK